jgi:hypothetical protein
MRPAGSFLSAALPVVLFALYVCLRPGAAVASDLEPDSDSLIGVLNDLDPKNPDITGTEPASTILDVLLGDNSIEGSNPTLLQREPQKFSADIVGGLRAMDCETLKVAEQTQAEHMGLLLAVRTLAPAPSLCAPVGLPSRACTSQAIRDANKDMTNATCVKAFTQAADVEIVYVKVGGLVNGAAKYRDCKLIRLRTQAGGRNMIYDLRTVDIDGTLANSAQQLNAIKEANRYQIDKCRDTSPTDDPVIDDVPADSNTQTLGLLDVSDKVWAQLRVHTATEDELRAVPDSWDERVANPCQNAQAIQSQGECGKPCAPTPCHEHPSPPAGRSTPHRLLIHLYVPGSCWAFAAARVFNDRDCASP